MTGLFSLLIGATCLFQGHGAVLLRGSSVSVERSLSMVAVRRAEWASAEQTETEDSLFWSQEWSTMETELIQILDAASPNGTANATANATAHKAHGHKGLDHKNPLAGLKLNLEPKSPADLVPALAMLKGLYEDGKERIAKLNGREQDSKKKYAEKEKKHNDRIAQIEARGKNHTLSADFLKNETKDEMRLWNYWERVRERQHRQFHTSLKIQHGTMERVKGLIDMYEKTISGKADKTKMAQELRRVGAGIAPEVVLLQDNVRATVHYCSEALVEVREAQSVLRTELQVPKRAKM
jgi:hypothetical protein